MDRENHIYIAIDLKSFDIFYKDNPRCCDGALLSNRRREPVGSKN